MSLHVRNSLIQPFLIVPLSQQHLFSFLRWSLLLTTASWEIYHLLWLQISQNYHGRVPTNQLTTRRISHPHLLLIILLKNSLIPRKYLKILRRNRRRTHLINRWNSNSPSVMIIHISWDNHRIKTPSHHGIIRISKTVNLKRRIFAPSINLRVKSCWNQHTILAVSRIGNAHSEHNLQSAEISLENINF